MIDEVFIQAMLHRGEEAKKKLDHQLCNLSVEQLNWKLSPEAWSIAQCLDHLIVSNRSYFAILDKISKGTYKMDFWQQYSPLSSLWGRVMKDQLKEQVKRKLKAPRIFTPIETQQDATVIGKYKNNLDTLLHYIQDCKSIDIDKVIITSPALRLVTYSLRDVFSFLLEHQHRHINQAIRVKTEASL